MEEDFLCERCGLYFGIGEGKIFSPTGAQSCSTTMDILTLCNSCYDKFTNKDQ